jgi:hypothetical protein
MTAWRRASKQLAPHLFYYFLNGSWILLQTNLADMLMDLARLVMEKKNRRLST